MAVHFCEVEHKTAVVSMNKMCEKPPRSATDILLMPSLFCFVPGKLADSAEWLRNARPRLGRLLAQLDGRFTNVETRPRRAQPLNLGGAMAMAMKRGTRLNIWAMF